MALSPRPTTEARTRPEPPRPPRGPQNQKEDVRTMNTALKAAMLVILWMI